MNCPSVELSLLRDVLEPNCPHGELFAASCPATNCPAASGPRTIEIIPMALHSITCNNLAIDLMIYP